MRQYECIIKPLPGEIVQAAVPLPRSQTALITGTVLSPPDTPVAEALVLLLRQEDGALLLSTLTDSEGRFYLGPVAPDTLYILRVQSDDLHTRILELTV